MISLPVYSLINPITYKSDFQGARQFITQHMSRTLSLIRGPITDTTNIELLTAPNKITDLRTARRSMYHNEDDKHIHHSGADRNLYKNNDKKCGICTTMIKLRNLHHNDHDKESPSQSSRLL